MLTTVLFLPSCSDPKRGPGPEPVGNPVEISARVARTTSDFAFDLLRTLQATQPADDNVFVSPLSLHIALGMLHNGATGTTAEEILTALHLEGISQEELHEAYSTLLKELPLADSHVALAIANAVWYRTGFEVKPDFKTVLADVFNASVNGEDFSSPATLNKINKWASDHTQGKIPKVLDSISPDHVMFLMNALYFKGDWKYQFDTQQTKNWPFTLADGSEKQVPMMFTKTDLRAYTTAAYQAVELPYASGQFNMTLLLPAGNQSVGELTASFDNTAWEALQQGLQQQSIQIGLPKFKLEYEVFLNTTLQEMGMEKAFVAGQAEFDGIHETARLSVDFVKQNTFLSIDEKGTEAAAVTTIGMELTSLPSGPRLIVADKPFVFVISEKTSNTILFTGRIMNP